VKLDRLRHLLGDGWQPLERVVQEGDGVGGQVRDHELEGGGCGAQERGVLQRVGIDSGVIRTRPSPGVSGLCRRVHRFPLLKTLTLLEDVARGVCVAAFNITGNKIYSILLSIEEEE
jgi:hypothetical protein